MRNRLLRYLMVLIVVGLAASTGTAQAQQSSDGPTATGDPSTAPSCDRYVATKWLTTPGTLNGTSGDDVLVGSSGNDVINGLGGNDIICGSTGDDCFFGNSNADTLNGGSGDDYLSDGCGMSNWADGGSGNDYVGVTGTAYGGSGNDVMQTFDSFGTEESSGVLADGGSGNDTLFGDSDAALIGNSGNDRISVFSGTPSVDCGSGIDIVVPGGALSARRCETIN